MVRISWLALSYNLPINPSKMRVYTWRKLREYGAEYLRQGVAILPNTAQSNLCFSQLAQKIRQMGGEASLLEMRFLDSKDEQELASRFQKQVDIEYKQLLEDCAGAILRMKRLGQAPTTKEMEEIRRIVKRYHRAKSMDHFHMSTDAREIEAGLNDLVENVRTVASDFGKQLRGLLDKK